MPASTDTAKPANGHAKPSETKPSEAKPAQVKSNPVKQNQARSSQEWPALMESGAGLSEAERAAKDPMAAPTERLPTQPLTLEDGKARIRNGAGRVTAEVKKRPLLYIGLGALALGGVAALLGRRAIFRAAAPMLVRAVARHPMDAARLAARHPRGAYRLIAMGVEPTVHSGMRTIRGLPQKMRDLELPQRVRDLELQQRLRDLETTLASTLQAVRELPQAVRDKVAHRG